jgi:hypothetical protein
VLAVQNIVVAEDLGAASSFVAFTRSLGGAIGVSALGAVLSHRVIHYLKEGFASAGIDPRRLGGGSGIPDLSALPAPIRAVVQSAYGSAIADIFLAAAPFALLALLVTFFLKEVKLRGRQPVAAVKDEISDDQRWNSPEDHPAHSVVDPSSDGSAVHAARRAALVTAVEEESSPLAVSGTVRQNARPLPGAQVTLTDQLGRQVARATSGIDGQYRLPLQHGGTFVLVVAAPLLNPTATLVAVGDRSVERDVSLVGQSAITGRVLGQDVHSNEQVGVPGALVTLIDVTGEVAASTRSGRDGGYSFERLIPGSYVLTAQSGRHRPIARTLDVPESGALACDLSLTRGGRLTGTVVAAGDGRGVREATITLVDGDGQVVASTTTNENGGYLLDDLNAGRYTLTASGYAPVAIQVDVDDDAVSSLQVTLGSAIDTARWVGWWHQVSGQSPVSRVRDRSVDDPVERSL